MSFFSSLFRCRTSLRNDDNDGYDTLYMLSKARRKDATFADTDLPLEVIDKKTERIMLQVMKDQKAMINVLRFEGYVIPDEIFMNILTYSDAETIFRIGRVARHSFYLTHNNVFCRWLLFRENSRKIELRRFDDEDLLANYRHLKGNLNSLRIDVDTNIEDVRRRQNTVKKIVLGNLFFRRSDIQAVTNMICECRKLEELYLEKQPYEERSFQLLLRNLHLKKFTFVWDSKFRNFLGQRMKRGGNYFLKVVDEDILRYFRNGQCLRSFRINIDNGVSEVCFKREFKASIIYYRYFRIFEGVREILRKLPNVEEIKIYDRVDFLALDGRSHETVNWGMVLQKLQDAIGSQNVAIINSGISSTRYTYNFYEFIYVRQDGRQVSIKINL